MEPSLTLQISAWLCALLGAGSVVAVVAALVNTIREASWDWTSALIGSLWGAGASALLFFGLAAAGFPEQAVWTWRATAIGLVLLNARVWVKSFADTDSVWQDLLQVLAFVFAVALAVLSCLVAGLKTVTEVPSPQPPASTIRWTIEGVPLWHNVALCLFAASFILFILLFIGRVRKGNLAQIESHWGGLGGGLGGWRISTSLSYLLAALLCGLSFTAFVYRLEPAPQPDSAKPSVATASYGAAVDAGPPSRSTRNSPDVFGP